MSTTTKKLALADAKRIADGLCSELAPACWAIQVVGSVRREPPEAEVGDIELLCVPKVGEPERDLFGKPIAPGRSKLDATLSRLVAEQRLEPGKRQGEKWKTFQLPSRQLPGAGAGATIELYLCELECWGVHAAIRTGPAAFSKALVTPRSRGGHLPAGHEIKHGFRLYRWGEFIETPTEQDFFDAIRLDWIEPAKR